ncbi:MAG TPA: hypothetical protein PLZ69_01040 [Candidatus Pacearchaeota archaeon]|nr:hypothetical protein [Candidatus Pacearchaeota archaeon]
MDNKQICFLIDVFILSNIFLWVMFWLIKWISQTKKGITPNMKVSMPAIKLSKKQELEKKIALADTLREINEQRDSLG